MDPSRTNKNPVLLTGGNKRFAMKTADEMHGCINMEINDDKGIITTMVENIKHFAYDEYTYKILLAGNRNEKWYYHLLGDLPISKDGKGETSFRFKPSDVDGKNTGIWDFCAIIIAAMSTRNKSESLHPVLKGTLTISKDSLCKKNATAKDYSPFYNNYILERCIEIAKMQKKFIDVIPFKHDLTKAQWKKITDCKLFPMVAPGAMFPMEVYGHFIFGWRDSHYFLGIPGRFFPEEQPDHGKSGFVFWQPLLGMEEESQDKSLPIEKRRENIYGYWIASINRYNGHIEEIPLIEE